MTLILDTGAFLAVERGNRDVVALIKHELLAGRVPVTHGGIVAQVWRGGRKQHAVARLLRAVEVIALDEELGRRCGVLLGRSRRSDAIDAALVLLATDDDWVLTSDPEDIDALARAAAVEIAIVRV